MDKKELLKKIKFKDYTNRLEKVLEKKQFSLDTKNLLLSMFYKIENAYPDYKATKVQVYEKADLFEKLIDIVKQKCNEILLEENEYTIDKKQGKIITIGNDLALLNSLLEIDEDMVCMPQEENMLELPITYFLNLGSRMNIAECIRDFNGWSWDTSIKEITNIKLNFVYQTFLYLLGHEFMVEWQYNESKLADYMMLAFENIKENYGEERAKKIIRLFCKFIIEIIVKQNKEQKEMWLNFKKEKCDELDILSDNKAFLENITKQKKKLTKEIEKIDKLLNNKAELEKEYQKRNEKLPNKEKIFSIRHLVNRLEIERQEYVGKIKKYNLLIDPKGYVARKEEVSKKAEFLKTLDLEQKEEQKENLIELITLFLECMNIKIAKAKTKQEIVEYIYELRYFRFLTFDRQGTIVKEIIPIQIELNKTMIKLIEKAKKLNVIEEITDDEKINIEIISKIFDSKMIELKNIVIESKVQDGKLIIEYYDDNILENTAEIKSNKTVKLKKKTKLFI